MPKFLTAIVNSFIFLGLASVTVWDIWLITNTYINENRVTLVTWGWNRDSYPFLRDTRLKIITYDWSNLLFELRNQGPLVNDYTTDQLEIISQRLEKSDQNSRQTNTSHVEQYAVAQLLSDIREMDLNAQRCMLGLANTTSCEYWENESFLQRLLKTKQHLLHLENDTWNGLKQFIIREVPAGNYNDVCSFFILDSLENESVTVSASLPDILSPQGSNLGAVNLSNLFVLDKNNTSVEPEIIQTSVRVIIREFRSDPIAVSSKETTIITITVTNNGIFDRTETTRCKDEPYNELLDWLVEELCDCAAFLTKFKSEPCKIREYIETTIQFCQCIPFTFRRQYALVNNTVPDQEDLPFCTSQIYLNCMEAVRNAFSESNKKCLPLCTQAKNQYSVSVSRLSWSEVGVDDSDDDRSSFTIMSQLIVQSHDQIYGLYTEKFQLTLQQYISQLGGDIGLYTGFSILGFWQILVFIYDTYKAHRKNQDQNGAKLMTRWNIFYSIFEQFFGEAKAEAVLVDDRGSEMAMRENINTLRGLESRLPDSRMRGRRNSENAGETPIIKEMQTEIAALKALIMDTQEQMTFMRSMMMKLMQQHESFLARLECLPTMADGDLPQSVGCGNGKRKRK